jgi:hypothetical protein
MILILTKIDQIYFLYNEVSDEKKEFNFGNLHDSIRQLHLRIWIKIDIRNNLKIIEPFDFQ